MAAPGRFGPVRAGGPPAVRRCAGGADAALRAPGGRRPTERLRRGRLHERAVVGSEGCCPDGEPAGIDQPGQIDGDPAQESFLARYTRSRKFFRQDAGFLAEAGTAATGDFYAAGKKSGGGKQKAKQ